MKENPPIPLLNAIHTLGEHMCAALDADDVEAFATFARERGQLVEQLGRYRHPSELGPGWEAAAAALARQHVALDAAMCACEARIEGALGGLGRLKEAHRSYGAPSATGGILRAGVRG